MIRKSKIKPLSGPRWMCLFLAVILLGLTIDRACAKRPSYQEVKKKQLSREQYNKLRRQMSKIIKSPSLDAASKKILSSWYTESLASMTRLANLGTLAGRRQQLFRELRSANKTPRSEIESLLIKNAPKISAGNYHPAVRYNAILMLGMLNDSEASGTGSNLQAPRPKSSILRTLLREVKNEKQIDAVRIGAMVGILRHAKLDRIHERLPDRVKNEIAEVALPFLTDPPPADRSTVGHNWMRRQAMEILAALGLGGDDGAIAVEIDKIVRDENEPVDIRCAAGFALGHLDLGSGGELDPSATAYALGTITLMTCDEEIARLSEWLDEMRENSPGGILINSETIVDSSTEENEDDGEGRRPRRRNKKPPQNPELKRSRRLLNQRLHCIRVALLGPQPDSQSGLTGIATAEPHSNNVKRLSDQVQQLIDLLNGRGLEVETLLATAPDRLRQLKNAVDAISTHGSKDGDPPAPESDPDTKLDADLFG